MIEAHLKKLRARDDLSNAEEEAVRSLVSEVVEVQQDRTVIRHDQDLHNSTMLLSGWLARAKDLPNGQRQLAELHVAGDFADLHSFTLKYLDHDVISLTPCRLALVPHERLREVMERFPHLARLYWLMTNIDAAIQREWTLSVGSRTAISRMAHLFCEMNVRLGIVDLAVGNSYDFPLTQTELGECLGLTSVHVNRTLQELRRRGLIDLEGRRLWIHDLEALKEVASFDERYLYVQKRHR
ncbi:MAG: Crp/Fnr family transcriptional regulator [Bacillota bacterium]